MGYFLDHTENLWCALLLYRVVHLFESKGDHRGLLILGSSDDTTYLRYLNFWVHDALTYSFPVNTLPKVT